MKIAATGIEVQRGSRRVLGGVDFCALPGEIVGIVGPNGAGKSTLLKALARLLPLSAGAIEIDGQPVAALTPMDIARRIAYLPQERVVHWPLSVRATVALGRLPYGGERLGSATDRDAVDRALAVADVASLAERCVAELSGGELARTLLARALAQATAILVADEPAAGLDLAHELALFARMQALAAEGRCVIVALHDLSLAARFCHKLVVLKEGRVVAEGVPGSVLSEALIAEVFSIRARLASADGVPMVVPLSTLER